MGGGGGGGGVGGPGIDIRFQWEGAKGVNEISRKLATWGQRVSDLSPAWEVVGTALLGDFRANYDSEGGVFGKWSRWPQLAPSTVVERARLLGPLWGAHPMLDRFGGLRASVTERGAINNVFEVGPNSLVIGTRDPVAGYHNSSAPRSGRLPRRAIVALSSQRMGFSGSSGSVVGILNGYLMWQLAQANLSALSGAESADEFLNPQ